MSANKAFTLVEVVIVIAVIAILATIAAVGLNGYLQDGRDRQRVANTSVLSEALEKYYDQNGEYPSCEAITGPADEVSANVLKGIDKAALLVPGANGGETNAIRCGETLTTGASTEFIEYVGDGSADCSGDKACLSYTLRYLSESENEVVEIQSRRTVDVATSGTPRIALGSTSYTSAQVSWDAIANTLTYEVQRSTNSSFSGATSYTATSTTQSRNFTDLAPDTTYYFRMRASTPSGATNWSNTVTAETPALGTPTLASTQNNPSQVTETWSSAAGATAYVIQRASNSGFSSNLESDSLTGTSKVYTDTPIGSARYYRVKATTTNSAGTVHSGSWSNVINYTSYVPAPSGSPSIAAAMSGSDAVGTSGTVSCSQGATPNYRLRYTSKSNSGSSDNWSSWSGWSSSTRTRTEAALQGHQYKFQAAAVCVYSGEYSSIETSSTATTVRDISQPAAPTWPSGLATSWKSGTFGHYMNYGTYCPTGTWVVDSWFHSRPWNGASPQDNYHTFGFNDYWYLGPSGGATVEYWARYVCGSSYATSSWSPERYSTLWVYP